MRSTNVMDLWHKPKRIDHRPMVRVGGSEYRFNNSERAERFARNNGSEVIYSTVVGRSPPLWRIRDLVWAGNRQLVKRGQHPYLTEDDFSQDGTVTYISVKER